LLGPLSLYFVSFFLPAVILNGTTTSLMSGAEAFLIGIFAIAVLQPVAVANYVFWVGLFFVMVRFWKLAAAAGIVAAILGLSVLSIYDPYAAPMPPPTHHMSLGPMEKTRVTQFSIGYYCWIASFACLTAVSLMAWAAERRSRAWVKNQRLLPTAPDQ
jgi:hypothetical protein